MLRHTAFIGLGANLPTPAGAPEQTLAAAAGDLRALGHVAAVSPLYRTEPVDVGDQPPFVNAVLQLETDLEPEALLDSLLAIERRYGRYRSAEAPKGPRTLDLDLLLVDELIVDSPRLTLPHPELTRRRFVLAPLCQVAPQWRHPLRNATMEELLAALPEEGANRRGAVHRLEAGQPWF